MSVQEILPPVRAKRRWSMGAVVIMIKNVSMGIVWSGFVKTLEMPEKRALQMRSVPL